ncbi:hypothetical protein HP062_16630 [Pseudomonas sp. B14-6]|uniref:hypothetical protein n=1 Tax=Pseudomonas sp. B14-6 TaxID=2738843 RepID=UPI00155EBD65|nr:hypothetical protein [Pseudomonas sp. B14-6]QKG67071.1 hypothetical protein HP062_16630 [Pseudomonas sp. B14-6]
MHIYGTSALTGALISWLFSGSPPGLIALSLLSVVWGVVLSRMSRYPKQWSGGVIAYCTSVLLFSSSLSVLVEMIQKGFYRAVLGVLPELFLMVLVLPLLAVVAPQLFRFINRD